MHVPDILSVLAKKRRTEFNVKKCNRECELLMSQKIDQIGYVYSIVFRNTSVTSMDLTFLLL